MAKPEPQWQRHDRETHFLAKCGLFNPGALEAFHTGAKGPE
jgi:hypothetical protein